MPRIQSEDKTKEAVFSFRLRVDVHAQMVAYGAFLNPDDPSSKDYVVTELFRESVKGDKEFAAYWEQNKARFLVFPGGTRTQRCQRNDPSRQVACVPIRRLRRQEMEDTNTIEREISSVRSEIRREQNELSRDPIGPRQSGHRSRT